MNGFLLWATLGLASIVPALEGGRLASCPDCECCGCCEKGTCDCTTCGCECCGSGSCGK